MPNRQLCIARELTKKFEEFRRGNAAELLAHYESYPAKGEIVLLISAYPSCRAKSTHPVALPKGSSSGFLDSVRNDRLCE